jgi:hypothetical protein
MWIAAGQGRPTADGEGAGKPEVTEGEDFTFAAASPVDREGYAVSEEERAEGGQSGMERPRPRRSAKGRSTRRDQ